MSSAFSISAPAAGIMFFTSWENYGTMEERVAQGAGARDWLITNVRIHDTGSNAVKLVMKVGSVVWVMPAGGGR